MTIESVSQAVLEAEYKRIVLELIIVTAIAQIKIIGG